MADYSWETGDAEEVLADVSLLQMGVRMQGMLEAMAQAQHAAPGLALAAVASDASAKAEAHVADAPLEQVHALGSAMLEAMAQAQHASPGLALAAVASNVSAKAKAHVADAPLGQVHALGSAMLEAMAQAQHAAPGLALAAVTSNVSAKAEAHVANASLGQVHALGIAMLEAMAQAQHAVPGLALAAVTSNVSAKAEAHDANAPLGQVHALGSALLEAMAHARHVTPGLALVTAVTDATGKVEASVASAAIASVHALGAGLDNATEGNGTRHHPLLYVLLAALLLLLLVIMWLACRSDGDERRPSGQAALLKDPAGRRGRRRPLDQALLAEPERRGDRTKAEPLIRSAEDLPHICVLRMSLDQESTFKVIMSNLTRTGGTDISGPSGKKFLGASLRLGPGTQISLAVTLYYAEEPLAVVIAPEVGDSCMEIYDQTNQVYGTIQQTEQPEVCNLVVRGRPVMQFQMQEDDDGQRITWFAVMGGRTLAMSRAESEYAGHFSGRRSVCHVQVQPGDNVVLLLLCMLALNKFQLSALGSK